MTVGRYVRVTGRVQGVFFRAWTREQAQSLGVSGWVRNRADGSLDAKFEGEASAVEELVRLVHDGPPQAQVDRVEVKEVDVEDLDAFEVRH